LRPSLTVALADIPPTLAFALKRAIAD